MPHPNFVLLFVDSTPASVEFYTVLLAQPPDEASPTFAMFALPSGLRLGLWSKHTAEPSPGPVGGSELAFALLEASDVDALHATWSGRGLRILQPPTDMDFGRTFVALDPDGHRLRVFAAT